MTEKQNTELETERIDESLPSAPESCADEKIKKNKIEVLALEGETKKERRIERTREIMQENSERARALASERMAMLEYGSEYRKELIARENKKAAEEKARLEACEREAEAVRETERNAEIEEFKEKERAELERRNKQAQKILEELNKEALCEETCSEQIQEVYESEAEVQEAESEESEEPEIPNTEENLDTDEYSEDSSEESERIILNIDSSKIAAESECPRGENIIYIPSVYCALQNGSYDINSETQNAEVEGNYHGAHQPSVESPYRAWFDEEYRVPGEMLYYDRNEVSDRELDDYEKELLEKHLSEFDNVDGEGEHADISIGIARSNPHGEDIGIFAKTELSKRLADYHKQENVLKEKLKNLDLKSENISYAESVRLIIEKIAIHKEIVEIAIEALRACVYAKSKANISKHKKFLVKEIYAYNSDVREYEILTGKQLQRISLQIADDVIEGKICDPIPNVYYADDEHRGPEGITHFEPRVSEEIFGSNDVSTASSGSGLTEDSDYDSAEARENEKIFEKEYSKRISEIRRISERDVLLVALRNEYKLSRYETEYHMLQHSFSADDRQKVKRMQKLDRKITKIRSTMRRSLKLERDDNRRYYYLLTVDLMKERVSRDARRDVLDALKLRLEILLAERAEINERIIALYGGLDKNLKNLKIERKAAGVRRKYTKVMYRRQQRLAIKVQRMRAPSNLKEKFFELLNKKTEKVSILEEKIYRLKRGRFKGKAQRELVRDVKNARRAIKYIDADIKYLMKKLRRHHQRYEDDRAWAITLIVFSVVAVAFVVGWYFYGDTVKVYLYDIWTRIKALFWL